ncbi:hypothetical protein C059_02733 [Brucella melitensis UK23/06]|nr:hypothetical protein C034_02464 [Brucella melitensis UK14/06]ENS73523.1 hypothetical protein C059_02733 [Brucella melitensis UK23/06]
MLSYTARLLSLSTAIAVAGVSIATAEPSANSLPPPRRKVS